MEIPVLGDLELAVLECLWDRGVLETRDVFEAVGVPRRITLSTIQSTLERLHRKRMLLRDRFGHSYRYASAMSRAEFRARAMASAAGDLKDADSAGVLAAFVDLVARSDRGRLDELAKIVEQARARRKASS